jgi:hypothetical protein
VLPLTKGSMCLDQQTPNRSQREENADQLREQASACRRLALQSRTRAGGKALNALGDHFDERARNLDPSSLKR